MSVALRSRQRERAEHECSAEPGEQGPERYLSAGAVQFVHRQIERTPLVCRRKIPDRLGREDLYLVEESQRIDERRAVVEFRS